MNNGPIYQISTRPLHSLIFLLMAFLSATPACAEKPATPTVTNVATDDVGTGFPKKWIGTYEPLSRACNKDILAVHNSRFSWGDCKEVKSQVLSASETGLVIEIDPNARCGWSGWIVALTTSSPESRAISVNAYRNLNDYRTKHSKAFCAYSKD